MARSGPLDAEPAGIGPPCRAGRHDDSQTTGFTKMKPVLYAGLLATALTASSALAAESGTQVGVLTCKMTGVETVVVYTREEFDCEYKPHKGAPQSYTGVIKEVGVNLSVTKENAMVRRVIAPLDGLSSPDALRGTYVGGSGQIEIGAGAAANILVGGSGKTISLQPISVNGMKGFGAALEISAFELK